MPLAVTVVVGITALATAVPCVIVSVVLAIDKTGLGTLILKFVPTVGLTTTSPEPVIVGLLAEELMV
jgi:hypothetical protein